MSLFRNQKRANEGKTLAMVTPLGSYVSLGVASVQALRAAQATIKRGVVRCFFHFVL